MDTKKSVHSKKKYIISQSYLCDNDHKGGEESI